MCNLTLILVVAMCALFFRQSSAWIKKSAVPLPISSFTRLHSSWSPNQGGGYQNRNSMKAPENSFSTNAPSFSNPSEGGEIRTFGGYSVYKGKAALNVKSIPPTFENVSKTSRKIAREGSLYLEFAPAGGNAREYNWALKTAFSLDVNECGALLLLDGSKGIEFTHDPKMGTSEAGQMMKKLSINPSPDLKGAFFRVQAVDKEKGKSEISVLLTWAELEVLKTLARYSIPYFLGFDKMLSPEASK